MLIRCSSILLSSIAGKSLTILLHHLTPPEIFVHLALICYVLGFLARGDLVLRGLILLGSGFYVVYYYSVTDQPLWEAIIGTGAIIVANIYSTVRIIRERSTWGMSAEGLKTYYAFNTLRPGQFRRLMRFADKRTFDKDTPLFERGALLDKVYFIQQGVALIERDERVSEIGTGDFIGELAFVRSTTASASVTVTAGAVLLEFDSAELKRQMASSDSLSNAIVALFNQDMAAKLAVSWPDEETLVSREKDKNVRLVQNG